jgi:hypothetical protein
MLVTVLWLLISRYTYNISLHARHTDTQQLCNLLVALSGNAAPLWRLLQHQHAALLIQKLAVPKDDDSSSDELGVPLALVILSLPQTAAIKAINFIVTHMPGSLTAVCSFTNYCLLEAAVKREASDIVDLLVKLGIDVNEQVCRHYLSLAKSHTPFACMHC